MASLSYLYVEDDRLSQDVMGMIMQDMLGISNYTLFKDTIDFIPRLEALEPQPDVILMDVHLTPLSGFETLDLLRAHPRYKDLCVIALTASVMNEEVATLREAGFDGVIGKPVDADTFPEVLEQIEAGHSVWKIT